MCFVSPEMYGFFPSCCNWCGFVCWGQKSECAVQHFGSFSAFHHYLQPAQSLRPQHSHQHGQELWHLWFLFLLSSYIPINLLSLSADLPVLSMFWERGMTSHRTLLLCLVSIHYLSVFKFCPCAAHSFLHLATTRLYIDFLNQQMPIFHLLIICTNVKNAATQNLEALAKLHFNSRW